MARVKTYKDLQVWNKAMDLVMAIYRHTETYPKHERFGLTSQTRRAATSIPANIAEGQARRHTAEFRNFLSIALGSLAEVETFFEIAHRLGYLKEEHMDSLRGAANEVGRMIHGPLRSLSTGN